MDGSWIFTSRTRLVSSRQRERERERRGYTRWQCSRTDRSGRWTDDWSVVAARPGRRTSALTSILLIDRGMVQILEETDTANHLARTSSPRSKAYWHHGIRLGPTRSPMPLASCRTRSIGPGPAPPLQLHLSALDHLVSPREMENNPRSIIMPTLLWMKNICRALCMPSFQIHAPIVVTLGEQHVKLN
jgi:hypothetical protein